MIPISIAIGLSMGSSSSKPAAAGDVISPQITNVTSSKANGTYTTGEVIFIQVTFTEVVNVVGGTPVLTLETGATDRDAIYDSGTGTNILVFRYQVQAGDTTGGSDLTYKATNSLGLGGSTIRDAALNNAVLTLPALGAAGSLSTNKNIFIDTIAPTVVSVSILNDGYTAEVVFSEPVTVDPGVILGITGSVMGPLNGEIGGNWSGGSGAVHYWNWASPVYSTETVLYTLDPGSNLIQDGAGNDLTGVIGGSASNGSYLSDSTNPQATGGDMIDATTVAVYFDEPVTFNATNGWSINGSINGSSSLTYSSGSGGTHYFTSSGSYSPGETLDISYDGTGSVVDVWANALEGFVALAINNNIP